MFTPKAEIFLLQLCNIIIDKTMYNNFVTEGEAMQQVLSQEDFWINNKIIIIINNNNNYNNKTPTTISVL